MALSKKEDKGSYLSRFINMSVVLKREGESDSTQPDVSQVWQIDAQGQTLELDKWHLLPTYRLKLTVFHFDRIRKAGTSSEKSVVIPMDFEGPDTANAAALELANTCRIGGEWVMLVSRKESEIDSLHQYAIGAWNWENVLGSATKEPCKWNLLDFERERMYSHMRGDLSAYVEVVRSWKAPSIPIKCRPMLSSLQHSNEDGTPPAGLPATTLYRFGRYIMQLRDARAWQPVLISKPLHLVRNEPRLDLLFNDEHNTCNQLAPDAWLSRNTRKTIDGLRLNVGKLRLQEQTPRNLNVRFDIMTAACEKPTEIAWHLSKQTVIAKDITMLTHKIWALRCRRWPKVAERIIRLLTTGHYRNVVVALFPISAIAMRTSNWYEYRLASSMHTAQQNEEETEEGLHKESNPSMCMCTVHRWRRKNFPGHAPLPIIVKSASILMMSLDKMALVPEWAKDPTYRRKSLQKFIPERVAYPEPTTLRGYIRRELETTRPVPRDAYIKFGVMTEQDCKSRWGQNWKLDGDRDQQNWDASRNVPRRAPKKEGTKETSRIANHKDFADRYPHSELDGYPGYLLSHELSPPCSKPDVMWWYVVMAMLLATLIVGSLCNSALRLVVIG